MAVIELSATLSGAADTKAAAGLCMSLTAVITRPKPSAGFSAPLPPTQGPEAVLRPLEAPEKGV